MVMDNSGADGGRSKRPSTPNVFQPNNAAQNSNQQYSSAAGQGHHNQSVMSEQVNNMMRNQSKSPIRRPESGRQGQVVQGIGSSSVSHPGRKASIHSSSQINPNGSASESHIRHPSHGALSVQMPGQNER